MNERILAKLSEAKDCVKLAEDHLPDGSEGFFSHI